MLSSTSPLCTGNASHFLCLCLFFFYLTSFSFLCFVAKTLCACGSSCWCWRCKRGKQHYAPSLRTSCGNEVNMNTCTLCKMLRSVGAVLSLKTWRWARAVSSKWSTYKWQHFFNIYSFFYDLLFCWATGNCQSLVGYHIVLFSLPLPRL